MFILVNTFHRSAYHVGAPISVHNTIEGAAKAMVRHGKAVKKANGPSSYLPMVIAEGPRSAARGELVDRTAVRICEIEESAHVVYA